MKQASSMDWIPAARRVLVAGLMLLAACHGGDDEGSTSGHHPDGGPPLDCVGACPAGYTCNDGVCAGGDARKLAFDLQTFPVSGRITVDGEAPVATGPTCNGPQAEVTFVDALPRAPLPGLSARESAGAPIACTSTDGTFSTRLPAGKYDVLAGQLQSATTFPEAELAAPGHLVVEGPLAGLAWDLATVTVSGKLLIDGKAPLATDPTCSGAQVHVSLVGDSGAYSGADIDCASSDGAFSVRVAPGTYRVMATQFQSASTFPAGAFVVQRSFTVTGAAAGLTWDLTTVPVSGTLRVDGKAPVATDPTCSGAQVVVELMDESGATVDASIDCASADGAFSARVAPGTYRVTASGSQKATTFPEGIFAVQKSLSVTGAKTGLTWDLTTVPISGKLLFDGKAPVATGATCPSPEAAVVLVDDSGALFEADLDCAGSDGTFSLRAAPGTYRAAVIRYLSPTPAPASAFVVSTSFVVTGAQTGLTWDLTTVPVAGTLKVDGMAPVRNGLNCIGAQVHLSLLSFDGAEFGADLPCSGSDGAFSLRAAPGSYRVFARSQASDTTFPAGLFILQDAITIP